MTTAQTTQVHEHDFQQLVTNPLLRSTSDGYETQRENWVYFYCRECLAPRAINMQQFEIME